VLAVTDHVLRAGSPWRGVDAGNHRDYLAEIDAQAERARVEYDLLHRPLGAFQPPRALRLGGRERAAGRRERRLPPARAPVRLENAPALCERADAVVDYLRSDRPAFLTRVDGVPLLRAA
jgi:hypothetical protein